MPREVRKVKPGWDHPRDEQGEFVPLLDGWPYGYPLSAWQAAWDRAAELWRRGEHPDLKPGGMADEDRLRRISYAEWHGDRPDASAHMPEWTADERAGWCYYEATSEGTPLSPVFATAEELAEWLIRHQRSWRGESLTNAIDYVQFEASPSTAVWPGWDIGEPRP